MLTGPHPIRMLTGLHPIRIYTQRAHRERGHTERAHRKEERGCPKHARYVIIPNVYR